MKRTLILGAAFLFGIHNASTAQQVQNLESEGNLSNSQKIQCTTISALSPQNNPVDIFTAASHCVEESKYQQAAELLFAGMSYGFFDTKRVSDKSAHQAISVLRMNTLATLSPDKIDALQKALSSVETTQICQSLIELGSPKYIPTYMIQHGMGAFTGQKTKDGLVENFDSESAWKETLTTIATCSFDS